MGLSQALTTAISGLRTTQAGLSLVSANVANAQTPGYTRKTLSQVTTAAGDIGVSVRAAAVNRELDQYLQRQLQTETSGAAYADLRSQYYQRIQQVYSTPGSANSLETIFNNFTGALQSLSTSPDDYSAQRNVLSSAQTLTGQLNAMTGQIQGLRSDAEQALSDAATSANNAMLQIAKINQQLATSNANDSTAVTLEDQRDVYVQQLAQLMDVRAVAGDHNQINVFTNSGIQLVGTQPAQLAFNPQGTVTPTAQWNADPTKSGVGTLTLVSSTGGKYDLLANDAIRSGQIAALVEMRDHVLVEAQNQLDGMAAAMAQALSNKTTDGNAVTVGAQSGFDIDVGGLLAGNSFNVVYTDTATGQQHNVTVVRVDDPNALPLSGAVTSNSNDQTIGVDFSGGIGGVVNQLNAKFGGKLQFSNPAGSTLRVLDDGAIGATSINSVTATQTETGLSGGSPALPFFTDAANPYSGAITSLGSQKLGFASRIMVNAALLADPSKLVAYQAGIAAGDSTRPDFIYQQLTGSAQQFSPDTGIGTASAPFSSSITTYLRQVISQQGEAASAADNLKQGQDVVLNSLQQRFNDGAGVNIDQEMANLLTLQNSYAANARVLSAVKDMLDTLLKM